MTKLPLVQLVNSSGKPYDFVVSGDPRTYASMVTPARASPRSRSNAGGIGANKDLDHPSQRQRRPSWEGADPA